MLRTPAEEDTLPGEAEQEEQEEEEEEVNLEKEKKGPGVGDSPSFDEERLEFYQRRFEDTARVIFQVSTNNRDLGFYAINGKITRLEPLSVFPTFR